jgi:hypothetical protein
MTETKQETKRPSSMTPTKPPKKKPCVYYPKKTCPVRPELKKQEQTDNPLMRALEGKNEFSKVIQPVFEQFSQAISQETNLLAAYCHQCPLIEHKEAMQIYLTMGRPEKP